LVTAQVHHQDEGRFDTADFGDEDAAENKANFEVTMNNQHIKMAV